MQNEHSSKTPKIIGALIGLAVIGGGIAWLFGMNKTPDTPDVATTTPDDTIATTSPTTVSGMPGAPTTTTPKPGTTPAPTPAPTPAHAYKDGTYRATGAYTSPAGGESVTVGVTLKDDKVVDATFQGNATNPTSKRMQDRFAAAYKQYVVGKDIASIKLGVVNGASLVPKGFVDALVKIKAQAQG